MSQVREPSDSYSEKETKKRMEDALRRALTTPHKPHSEMKIKEEAEFGG